MWLPPLGVLAVSLACWYAVSYGLLEPSRRFLLPPPHRVVAVGLLNGAHLARTLDGLLATAKIALIGLGLAAVLGILLAVLMSQARWVERSLFPWAVVVQATPIIAVIPLIGLWFGYSLRSRVLVCVMISIFPVITATLFGLQSADTDHHDLFTLHRASRFTRLWKLELPGALPAIFAGLRISAGLSVIGAIVADVFFGQGEAGIGQLIETYQARLQTEQLLTAVGLSCLLGLALFWLFGYLRTVLTGQWNDEARR